MKVILAGSSGRDSAVAAQGQSFGHEVLCVPGNAGIPTSVPDVKPTDVEGLLRVAESFKPDLIVFTSEAPIVMGVSDKLRDAGHLVFAPSQVAALTTEGSKRRFKELCIEAGVPTAPYVVYRFDQMKEACESGYIFTKGAQNIVVKADGLCDGKGVFLPETVEEVLEKCAEIRKKYGDAAEYFIVEDRLYGQEFSDMGFSVGRTFVPLPGAQDAKRLEEGGKGPNTGGMGAFTLEPPEDVRRLCDDYMRKLLHCLVERGAPYYGIGYGGFILTEQGPIFLEWNCRPGDPEWEAVLFSMYWDFIWCAKQVALKIVPHGVPDKKEREVVCVVLASDEYPGSSLADDAITGIDKALESGAFVFHGATGRNAKGEITTNKAGRVLFIVCYGKTLEEACERIDKAISFIRFGGRIPRHRKDIGKVALAA